MSIETIEYSVCEDCLLYIAYDDVPEDREREEFAAAVEREIGVTDAHFTCGIEPAEDDPDGAGYDEFSSHQCELCRTNLAGSRHGLTLVIQVEDDA